MTTALRLSATRRYGTLSPLRYPGGKAALAGLFEDVIAALDLSDATYVEPYAGGAGAGVALLRQELVAELVINDIDPAVHAFWRSIKADNDRFVEAIQSVPLNMEEWRRQRALYRARDESDPFSLGFAFFYLNRTNRSGVLNAGVIGGNDQSGNYKIDARFNRDTLAERVGALGRLADRISVTDADGRSVIRRYRGDASAFMYIDPPYVTAGSKLYLNAFDAADHEALAREVLETRDAHWLVTYDVEPLVERLYRTAFQCRLELNYSARHPGSAQELVVASGAVASVLRKVTTADEAVA